MIVEDGERHRRKDGPRSDCKVKLDYKEKRKNPSGRRHRQDGRIQFKSEGPFTCREKWREKRTQTRRNWESFRRSICRWKKKNCGMSSDR